MNKRVNSKELWLISGFIMTQFLVPNFVEIGVNQVSNLGSIFEFQIESISFAIYSQFCVKFSDFLFQI